MKGISHAAQFLQPNIREFIFDQATCEKCFFEV